MTEPELTEAMIEAAMAKAEARACTGSDRCYALPVWLEVSTGLVKLIRQTDA